MAHTEKCPVCGGKGKITIANPNAVQRDLQINQLACYGCGGKGWVEVEDKPEKYKIIPYHHCCLMVEDEATAKTCRYHMQGEGLCGWPANFDEEAE